MAEQKISPAIIIPVGLGLGLAALVGIAALARAAPPKVDTCPLCGEGFDTLEELEAHFALAHPEEPMPTPWGYSDVQCSAEPDPVAVWWKASLTATITNIGDRAATKLVSQYWRRVLPVATDWAVINENELTLSAGEARSFTPGPNFIITMPGSTIETYLVDSDGYESEVCQVTI